MGIIEQSGHFMTCTTVNSYAFMIQAGVLVVDCLPHVWTLQLYGSLESQINMAGAS